MPKARHVLLADGPPTDKLLAELGTALKRVAAETEVSFGKPATQKEHGVTTHTFTDVSDKHQSVMFVNDPQSGRRIVVTGRRSAAIAGVLAEALPAERSEDLIERASGRRDPRAIVRVALAAADDPSPEADSVVVTALRSTDPEQVDAGITAAAMTDPARFAGDLYRIAAEAPDQDLRLKAEQALAGGGRG